VTPSADLERRRLEHRARRLELVLAALRDGAVPRAEALGAARPLRQAIAGFSSKLEAVRRHLAEPSTRDS
jgi:hypothetical protein